MSKALQYIHAVARKFLTKKGEGITSIGNRMQAESKASEIASIFQESGLPLSRLDEFIKSEKDVIKYLNIIEESAKSKVKQSIQPKPLMKSQNPADVFDLKGNRIKNTDNIMGGQELPGEINIFSNKYLNDLDKKIIDSDAFGYSQKEWNALSNSSKEKFRKQFDSNYADAMENTQMATLKEIGSIDLPEIPKPKKDPALYEDRGGNIIPAQFKDATKKTDAQILEKLNKGNKEGIERLKNKPLDPDDVLPDYNETPGEFARRETPGSKENLLQELKIAYEKEFNRLRGDETAEELKEILKNLDTDGVPFASGGRAGYYGGGQAMVGEDLSEIGHGSDALMARNMQIAPGGQATTSTGLNYLLGQDNDTARVPYNEGKKVEGPNPKVLELMLNEKMSYSDALKELKIREKQQPYIDQRYNMGPGPILEAAEGGRIGYKDAGPVVLPKPKPTNDFQSLLKIYNTYKDSMPGVSEDTQKYLAQDFINKLNEKGLSQTQFQTLRMQNHYEESKADGGRIGFKGGGSDASTSSFSQSFDNQHGTNTASRANKSVDRQQAQGQGQADATNARMANTDLGREQALNNYITVNYPNQNPNNQTFGQKIGYGVNKFFNNPYVRTYATIGTGGLSEKLRSTMLAKKMYDNRNILQDEIIEDEVRNIPISGGITSQYTPYAEGGPARQGFKMGKRAFLKAMGAGFAGIASLKTGLLGFGKKEIAKSVVAPAAQAANEAAIPPYFFKLVDKIKMLGDDVTEKAATKDREIVKQYKDFQMTEDVTTGEIQIFKTSQSDEAIERFAGENATEEVFMRYKPSEKILLDESNPTGGVRKTMPEYEENTSYISNNRGNTGGILDDVDGVPDDVLREVEAGSGNVPESFYTGSNPIKKADGGRIGYKLGKKVIQEGIPGLIKKVNKLFGKEVVTTADKLKLPQKTLDRDLFNAANKRINTSTTPESEKIVGDILEETDINSLFDADGKLNKDAVLNAATKTPVQQEGKFTKAEYLIQRLENTIKESPDDKYINETFPGFIKELKNNPELAKNENVFKELGGDLPEGQQIVVYGDDTLDFFTQKSGPGNIDRLKKLMAKHNISREKALKIMKMEPNDQVMELKMLEVANRKLHATGGLASMLGE